MALLLFFLALCLPWPLRAEPFPYTFRVETSGAPYCRRCAGAIRCVGLRRHDRASLGGRSHGGLFVLPGPVGRRARLARRVADLSRTVGTRFFRRCPWPIGRKGTGRRGV